MRERLQKVLAQAGVASRRTCEEWIRRGWVEVNGQVVTQLGTKVDPHLDDIRVRGRRITAVAPKIYIALNKPRGVITSTADPHGRPVVTDLLPPLPGRIFPVGRLDFDTEGLLLLTNDGEMAHRLMHPRYEVKKVYLAWLQGIPHETTLQRLREGIQLEDGPTAPCHVRLLRSDRRRKTALCRIAIHEGRNRQVRRMFAAVGHPVTALRRIQHGPIQLGRLRPGEYRFLSQEEVASIKNMFDTKGS